MTYCSLTCKSNVNDQEKFMLKMTSVTLAINCVFLTVLLFLFSGMTAVICTYPLDVVRARLAFQVKGEHRYTGIGNAFQTIYLKVGCSHSKTFNTFTNVQPLNMSTACSLCQMNFLCHCIPFGNCL